MSSEKPVMINGELVDPQTASISIWDMTMMRGDGLFDIIAVEKNSEGKLVLVGLDLHLVRLFRCAKQVLLDIKQTKGELEAWMRKAAELGGPGKLRMLVTRGGTQDSISHMGAGVSISDLAPPKVVIMWQEVDQYKIPGSLLPLEYPWNCCKSEAHSTIKWLSYASNMLMTRTAVKSGFDDALLRTEDGYVLEGPTFAVNWITNGEIFTPSVEKMKILPSVTMAIAMTALQSNGYKINIGKYKLEELLGADEVFVTSATRMLIPISRIGDKELKVEVGMKLRELVKKALVERENWIGHLTSPYDFPLDV